MEGELDKLWDTRVVEYNVAIRNNTALYLIIQKDII